MSYQKERDEFIGVIVEELHGKRRVDCPAHLTGSEEARPADANTATALARLILRNAQTIQRIAVAECNREVTGNESMAEARAMTRIQEACKPWGIKPNFSGDPRGACVKLLLPSGRWNSWGGAEEGFCVPTR